MENKINGATKIVIGDLELWTAPFGAEKATITALEGGTKLILKRLHDKLPDVFDLMVDDEDFCEEDMEGAFSVIVDPEVVTLSISPGLGKFGFSVSRQCDGDCENCELNDCKDREEASADE